MEKYLLSYNEEDDILYLKILGITKSEDLRELMPRVQKLLEGKTRRRALVDMSESVPLDASMMTREMRDTYKELNNLMNADKAAILGASPSVRMVARIVLAVTGKSKTAKFFKTKEEALAWLKGVQEKVKFA